MQSVLQACDGTVFSNRGQHITSGPQQLRSHVTHSYTNFYTAIYTISLEKLASSPHAGPMCAALKSWESWPRDYRKLVSRCILHYGITLASHTLTNRHRRFC